eukprot:1339800-Amorphochlora_amoeboformis.AAC.1
MGRSLDPNNANQLEKYLSISYLTHKGHKDVAVSSRDLRPLPDDTIVGKEAGNSSPNGYKSLVCINLDIPPGCFTF